MNQDVGDRQTIAGDLSNLGDVAAKRGNFDRAAERFEEALDIFRNVGDRIGVASTLSDLGRVERKRENYTARRDSLKTGRPKSDVLWLEIADILSWHWTESRLAV